MYKIFLLFSLLILSMPASADVALGQQALKAGNFQAAYNNLNPAALGGDANAQFAMCGMYFLGQGVPKNDLEAFRWCQQAAQQRHVEAMYNVGLFYQKGTGTQQNFNEAIKWYQLAAEKDHKDAQFNLLQLYNANKIADQRIRMETAKTAGIVPPLLPNDPALGMGRNLQNVQQNIPQVVQAQPPRPMTAAEQQQLGLQKACLQAAQQGVVAENCDFSQAPPAAAKPALKPAPPTTFALEQQAAQGDVLAQNNLGVMYRRGKGIEKNPQKAFALFEQAAAKGSTNAMLNLANMHKLGEGTPQNLELAYAWYNLAADRIADQGAKKTALANIKEIAGFLSNEQIANALEYVTKLDESVPIGK